MLLNDKGESQMTINDTENTINALNYSTQSEYSCDDMYRMGSAYELSEEECKIDFLAEKMNSESISDDYKDFSHIFRRSDGGYIEQIKRFLNIDLNDFDFSNIRNKREKIKILYFLYKTKAKFPNVNILELLSNQSMENITPNSFHLKTYNGDKVNYILGELEKEIDRDKVTELCLYLDNLAFSFDKFLDSVRYEADFYCSMGKDDTALLFINERINEILSNDKHEKKKLNLFPIETLYFRIRQYEYIGQIKDILFINSININLKKDIPSEMIGQMKEFTKCKVNIDEIYSLIDKPNEIARYVYLRDDIEYNDIRKIQRQKSKIENIIEFLYCATPLKPVEAYLEKLHIISLLQAIILDEKNETFDYTFYGYQKFMKHKQHVQVSVKSSDNTTKALKTYWNRKINDHWYANIGRYQIRCKLRELENVCDNYLLNELYSF